MSQEEAKWQAEDVEDNKINKSPELFQEIPVNRPNLRCFCDSAAVAQ